eukprot:TRINITY_DN8238_c0_g4_i1.p1 TRINITY_DN8238_c0_g4~~TRINITY_DN8238_c0_g4_i1.p1  ORF type:complete len:735 (+),score=47.26 TRINITY_DN8238_c0_g4_i1:251-2206(+)
MASWDDWDQIVNQTGGPWNLLIAVPNVCMLLVNIVSVICNRKLPLLFTENRRVSLLVLIVSRFTLFSRPVMSTFFDVDAKYVALMRFFPHSTWVVLACMVLTTVSCQSACFRCARSWIMCVYSLALILAYSFALPQGREGGRECLQLAICYFIHALICFYGQAASELIERRFFLNLHEANTGIVKERVKRYQAERKADDSQTQPAIPSGDQASSSHTGTQASEAVSSMIFRILNTSPHNNASASATALTALEALGEDEHWLILSKDLQLHPNRILGAGGFGSVVVGTYMASEVAVKVPKSDNRGVHPLAMEMRHLRKLRHPCIVSFLGICLLDDHSRVLLVEEWVDGDNLETFIWTFGCIVSQCVELRQQFLLDISAALVYLHNQPTAIVHGDLKPGNVIIDRRSLRAKLTDFGHARRADIDDMAGGSLPWMEPTLRKTRRTDGVQCSTDVWAFGCVAFFVCAGVGPWKGNCMVGSSSKEEFGANMYRLWQGETDVDEKLIAWAKKGPKQISISAEDVKMLSTLCFRCMEPELNRRPTSGDVNMEIRGWRKATDKQENDVGGLSQTSSTTTLDEQVAEVCAKSQSASVPPRLTGLRTEMLIQVRDVFRQQVDCLRALPGLETQREAALNVIQVLLATVIEQDGFNHAATSL